MSCTTQEDFQYSKSAAQLSNTTPSNSSKVTKKPPKAHKNKRIPPSCSNCQERRVKCDRVQPCEACCLKGIYGDCKFMLNAKCHRPVQQAYEIRTLRLAKEDEKAEKEGLKAENEELKAENEGLKALLKTAHTEEPGYKIPRLGSESMASMPASPLPTLPMTSMQAQLVPEYEASIADVPAAQPARASTPRQVSTKPDKKPVWPNTPVEDEPSNYQALEDWRMDKKQKDALKLIARSGNNVRIISKAKSSRRDNCNGQFRKSSRSRATTRPPPGPTVTPEPSSPPMSFKNITSFTGSNEHYTDTPLPTKPETSSSVPFNKDNTSLTTPADSYNAITSFSTNSSFNSHESPSNYSYTESPSNYSFTESPINTTDFKQPLPPSVQEPFEYISTPVNYTATPSTNTSLIMTEDDYYCTPWLNMPQSVQSSLYPFANPSSSNYVTGYHPSSSSAIMYPTSMGGARYTSNHGLNIANEMLAHTA